VVEVVRTDDKEIEHSFEYGRPVCFFRVGGEGSIHYFNWSVQISYVQDDKMVVILPNPEALIELQHANTFGVQLYFDETSYKAMFAAITSVMNAKNNRLAHLRDVLLGKNAAMERHLMPIRFPWLNLTQEEAVNKVLRAKDVAVVHGPPGTGKTTTLEEAICETLQRENQVLVCAQSNTALDWIAEKLVDRGISVLRIGNPTRVNDKMLSFTYERRFEAHPDYPELWSIRKAIRDMQRSMRRKNQDERETIRNRMSRLRFRATELELAIDASLFDQARVVASTLIGASNRVLESHRFTSLFIDEAAQALEAACWVAINKADRVVFAGDHFQLPPTIKCLEAAKRGLSETLMQKVATRKPLAVSLLKIQYRMHDDIMGFPSAWFYNDELIAAAEVKNRGILAYDTPLVWINTDDSDSSEAQLEGSLSKINKTEANVLIETLHEYIEKIGKERILDEKIDFGLISPYKAQIQYIRSLIKKDGYFKPFKKLITVHTVDGFQGQERDVIVISLVRSNNEGQIGFLQDLRRMNVAITRARMKLIILGNASTLTKHSFYKQLFDYIKKKGKIISVCTEEIS
jgi:superfamily I DNA and/or RNA helicase